MATFQEHMIADFIRSLEESGKSVVIDGVLVDVFEGPVLTDSGEFERQNVSTWKLFHLAGAIEEKVPGQLVDIGGERWEVLDHRAAGVSACLSLMRGLG